MDYRKLGDTYYLRMDRGDEIVASILDVCKKEGIRSATFSGIGGCSAAVLQIFSPVLGGFETEHVSGILEMISLLGNVISDESGALFSHAHTLFAYHKDGTPCFAGGHLKSTAVLFTAEIELRPVAGGVIGREPNVETGTGFWKFETE